MIRKLISRLKLRVCTSIARLLLGRIPDEIPEPQDPDFQTRQEAIAKLQDRLPDYFPGEECSMVAGGTFSWQRDYSENYDVPPLDLVLLEQGVILCLYPDPRRVYDEKGENVHDNGYEDASSDSPDSISQMVLGSRHTPPVLGSRRRVLELLFRNRLLWGQDPIPFVPIFCDPQAILDARDSRDLSYYIEDCWQDSVNWAIRQMPPLDHSAKTIEPRPGSPLQRRLWLDEASKNSLFPLRS